MRLFPWFLVLALVLALTSTASAQPLPAVFDLGHDTIPNFAQAPTLTSAQAGPWSAPATWSPARVPTATDVVLIQHRLTYGSQDGIAQTVGITQGGALIVARDRSTRLAVGTLMVLPGGVLDLGTPASPIPATVTAEILIRDLPIDTTDDGVGVYDPRQFGTGLLAIDGTVTMHGAPKQPTFVRLASEPLAGVTTLTLAQAPTGWQPGDLLLLPDTRQMRKADVPSKGARSRTSRFAPQWETPTIKTIQGTTITLAQPLQFAHLGARDVDGTLDFLPHVGNLTRNVIVRSENPNGTPGHILLTRRTSPHIRYTEIAGMGRTTVDIIASSTFNADGSLSALGTNQIGRYALHLHHNIGPQNPEQGHPFVIEGNAVRNTRKWGIALHDSHYGLIRQNVVYNADGAGLVTEDGSESYNVIEENFAVRNDGSGFGLESRGRGQEQQGHDGSGFWFRGGNNYVRKNVSANARNAGFLYNALLVKPAPVPIAPGADPTQDGQSFMLNPQITPLLEFSNNESYGHNMDGLEVWQNNEGKTEVSYRNLITGFRAWHVAGALIEAFYTDGFRIVDLIARGDVAALADACPSALGLPTGFQGHVLATWRITQADIQGLCTGLQGAVKDHLLADAFLRNRTNVLVHFQPQAREPSKQIDLTPHTMTLRKVRFAALPGQPLVALHAGLFTTTIGLGTSLANTSVFLEDYQGQSGANFQVFFKEQHPSFVVPPAKGRTPQPRLPDALQEGMTNQENWDRYGLTLLSAFPECTDETTHPEILGYTCPLATDRIPPLMVEHPVPVVTATTAEVAWTTDEPTTGRLRGYRLVNNQPVDVQVQDDATLRTTHTLGLTGLRPGIPYRYVLSGQDTAGNPVTTPDLTFRTAEATSTPPPTPPPVEPPPPVSMLALNNLRIGRNGPDVYVQWTTSVPAVATVEYGLTPALGTVVTRPASTSPRVNITGLTSNTLYYAKMRATDATGATVTTDLLRLGTRPRQNLPPPSPLPDTTPPVIYNPIVLFAEPTAATIMWEINELAQNVLEYGTTPALGLQQLPTTKGQFLGHAHVEFRSGLTPNTTYYFRGVATDASGQRTVTPVLTLVTPPLAESPPVPPEHLPGDTTGPVLSELHAHSVTATSVHLAWLTDEPATTTVAYGLTQAFGTQLVQEGFATRHSAAVCGLTPGTTYAYQISATDSGGHRTLSPVLFVTTEAE